MTTFAVLGTGPSMTLETANRVRGSCKVVAVSDAYRLAPWADAIVSHDPAWWAAHPEAFRVSGRRFCGRHTCQTELIPTDRSFPSDCNSGLEGMRVAYLLGASRILLLGFDMHGSHFFGKHQAPLQNTTPTRFKMFMRQFERWNKCSVINCTPGSALDCFPMSTLAKSLGTSRSSSAALASISGAAEC